MRWIWRGPTTGCTNVVVCSRSFRGNVLYVYELGLRKLHSVFDEINVNALNSLSRCRSCDRRGSVRPFCLQTEMMAVDLRGCQWDVCGGFGGPVTGCTDVVVRSSRGCVLCMGARIMQS